MLVEEMMIDGLAFEIEIEIWTFSPVSPAMDLTCRGCDDTMRDVAVILNVEVTGREEDVDGHDI